MLVIISPAKSLNTEADFIPSKHLPRFLDKSATIVKKMSKLTKPKLKSLMKISDTLAQENHRRYQEFQADHHVENSVPAVQLFDGDVYKGMEVESWTKAMHKYAQNHLRILSGLYGLLTPLDLIQPYRLEMGTKIGFGRSKNLYEYWRKDITPVLSQDLATTKNDILVNLASDEYWKAIDSKQLNCPIIKPNFKANRNGQIKFLSYDAKRARGMMAKWIFENKVRTLEHLKTFDVGGYVFEPDLSTDHQWIFVK